MSPGYRHIPLSRRLGLSFNDEAYWRVDMAEAECFMYFVAGLRQLFGDGEILYVEGTRFDPEVEAFYREAQAPAGPQVSPLLRHPKARAYRIPLSKPLHQRLSRFATCKTFADMAEAMLVLSKDKVLMDGRRIGERVALFSGELSEAKIRRFCAGKVHGKHEWVEEGGSLV